MDARVERRLLQILVALGAIVPVLGGAFGLAGGFGLGGSALDSHVRYLSGLLLGIGLAFWWLVPRVERHGAVFRVLGLIIVVGGLSRLAGATQDGLGPGVALPLVMELGVTPALLLWRERVARRWTAASGPAAGG